MPTPRKDPSPQLAKAKDPPPALEMEFTASGAAAEPAQKAKDPLTLIEGVQGDYKFQRESYFRLSDGGHILPLGCERTGIKTKDLTAKEISRCHKTNFTAGEHKQQATMHIGTEWRWC